jgi:hypothetical protein
MSDGILAIGTAIYNRLHAQATVDVYYAIADQGATPPYTVYQRMTASDEYAFGTARQVNADYMVKVISNRKWPGEALAVYEHIHNAMQDAPLAVTGFTCLRCRRSSTIEYRDPDSFWHVGGIFSVEITT